MFSVAVALLCVSIASAHIVAWTPGMYCMNGTEVGKDNRNNIAPVQPLYQRPVDEWWFHAYNNCTKFPPPDGEYLDLPAGGNFMVQLATNRAFTTYTYGSKMVNEWPGGTPDPMNDDMNNDTCIVHPNMHTQNKTMAAGTAFAISYTSDMSQVTEQNLVVFSVRYHTPWKRETWYDVPAAMPPCPPGGCICAWSWVPNGCGVPNMYMFPYKCRITNATGTAPLATPQPPQWCQDEPDKCVKGAKQMIYWHQAAGDNIEVTGYDNAGQPKSPGYNEKCGFEDGAQNDIFTDSTPSNSMPSNSVPSASTPSSSMPPDSMRRAFYEWRRFHMKNRRSW